MKGDRPISVIWAFRGVTVTKNTASTGASIDLSTMVQGASFSLWYSICGGGTVKFEYLSSFNGVDFLEPSGASDIAATKTVTAGTVGHWIVVGDYLHIDGAAGMVEINNKVGLVASVVANTSATVGIASSGFTTYTSGGLARVCNAAGIDYLNRLPVAITGISKAASAVVDLVMGNDMVSFSPVVAPYMKIRATETVNSADAIVNAILVVQ